MSLPIRRARRRRNLGVTDLAAQAARLAPEIELGWNNLHDLLDEAGWPTRSPEGDQKPRRPNPWRCDCGERFTERTEARSHQKATGHVPFEDNESSTLDYADPTGDLASGPLRALHGDLLSLREHRAIALRSFVAMHLIAKRHRPTLSPAVPGCIVGTCDEPVESRTLPDGRRAYLGMEQIAGHWVAKPGCTPTCKRHRSRRERDSAA